MKIKNYALYLLFAWAGGLLSCNKDEVEAPEPDFTIESTSSTEVIESYPNGWIKKANYYQGGDLAAEYELHANGYVKTCNRYFTDLTSPAFNRYLGIKVERNEDNQTVSSEYYYPDGSPYASFTYNNGQLEEKKVYVNGLATFTYTDGQVQRITYDKGDSPHRVEVMYNYPANTRSYTIYESDMLVYTIDEHIPDNALGYGYLRGSFVPTQLSYDVNEPHYRSINTQTIEGQNLEPEVFVPEDVIPQFLSIQKEMNILYPLHPAMIVNTDVYRNSVEQFLPGEEVFQLHTNSVNHSYSAPISYLPAKQADESEEVYHLKYGDFFHRTVYYGKYFFITGVLRNMPTNDPELREKLEQVASKKMAGIFLSDISMTSEEEALLGNVFFEIRAFSNTPGYEAGAVLNSYQDYEQFLSKYETAEGVIQYKSDYHFYQ